MTHWLSTVDKRKAVIVALLFYVNLLNYMDRSTVAGMISFIKDDEDFDIHSDQYLGLLQTAFVISYMLFAPLFGYLGDRYRTQCSLSSCVACVTYLKRARKLRDRTDLSVGRRIMQISPSFRYDRTRIMVFGLTLWCLATFVGSFMKNFWLFLSFRAFVGIGEASYSTIAPAIISDLFCSDARSKVRSIYLICNFENGM